MNIFNSNSNNELIKWNATPPPYLIFEIRKQVKMKAINRAIGALGAWRHTWLQ